MRASKWTVNSGQITVKERMVRKIKRITVWIFAVMAAMAVAFEPSPWGEGAAYRNLVAADEVAHSSKLCYLASIVKIYDGDTITVQDAEQTLHRVRLYAIDAPELRQKGGEESWKNLVKLLSKSDLVQVDVQNKDLYGREVGVVYNGGINVNRRQVAEGYAWHYRQYDRLFKDEFAALERKARSMRLGIWASEEPVEPWEWRRQRRRS